MRKASKFRDSDDKELEFSLDYKFNSEVCGRTEPIINWCFLNSQI